ncbi:MAG: HPr family phosphocarrier protein [Oscillospiraceae bacterium]|jgi:phosphotransferase system HPr-like phosphotransfer protein|nr:HPr family phosphocarrier protein [Oscillospiraceae bacterium]
MYQANVTLTNIDAVKSFVSIATKTPFSVDLVSGRYTINAKSIMGVLSLPLANLLTVKAECEEGCDFVSQISPFIVA